jgi:hypothetical protein
VGEVEFECDVSHVVCTKVDVHDVSPLRLGEWGKCPTLSCGWLSKVIFDVDAKQINVGLKVVKPFDEEVNVVRVRKASEFSVHGLGSFKDFRDASEVTAFEIRSFWHESCSLWVHILQSVAMCKDIVTQVVPVCQSETTCGDELVCPSVEGLGVRLSKLFSNVFGRVRIFMQGNIGDKKMVVVTLKSRSPGHFRVITASFDIFIKVGGESKNSRSILS